MKFSLNINFFLGLLFLLVFIPLNIKPYFIALFGVSVIYKAIKQKVKFNFSFFVNYSLLFLGISVTIFYSENISIGLTYLERMSSLIVFPFIFSFMDKDEYKKININYCIWIYILSIILFHLIVYIFFVINYFSFSDTVKHFQEIINTKIGRFNIHPIYLSMHCCIALLLSINLIKKKNKFVEKVVLHFLQFTLLVFLIWHSKKGPIIGLLLSYVAYLVLFKKTKNILKTLFFLVVLVFLFFLIPKVNERFQEVFNVEELSKENANSTNIRVAIYKNAIEVVKKSPYVGYGIGDSNLALINNYKNDILLKDQYNSHNQYLSFLVIGGPMLLIIYLFFFFKHINIALKEKNKTFFILLLFYSTVMLTENILERENGVIFFSLFLSLFGLKNYFKIETK